MGDESHQRCCVFATRTVHSPFPSHLPVIKGDILTVIQPETDSFILAENKHFIRGLVNVQNVRPVDLYTNEDFFLVDFTAKMAQIILADKPCGTFLVRSYSRDSEKIVISVIFNSVRHYTFVKNGGGIEYDGVVYQSIPRFVNKCCNTQNQPILDGYLGHWIKLSEVVQLPLVTSQNYMTMQKMILRIVAGSIAVAVDDYVSNHSLFLSLSKGNQYTVIRASRDPQFYIARDEEENEGYVAASMLECYIPEWFHGRMEREEAEQILNKTCRDGTFLVRERPSKPGMFALSVWCPDGIIHVPLAYSNTGQLTTGNSPDLPVFDCLLDLVDHYRRQTAFWTISGECVRTLFPLSRRESLLPDEIQRMDLPEIEMYFKALKEGKEHVRDIRLMVVGHYGAGKSTLTQRLMGRPFTQLGSTNGIEIHVRQCQYNIKTGQWCKNRPGSAFMDDEETHAMRLQRLLESPDEERTSVLEDFKRLTNARSSSNRNSGDFTLNSTSSDISMLSQNDSCASLQESLSDPTLSKTSTELEESLKTSVSDYQIDMDKNNVARYKFSESTLKAISQTFGRNRHDSKSEKYGFISMWDFAGQYIFYATHQVFLSSHAVYLLVLDLSKDLDEFVQDEEFPLECVDIQGHCVKDYGTFWLRSIHTFCGNVPGQPPVILIGTHKDQMKCCEERREEFAEKYFEDFRKLVEKLPVSNHIQPEQFIVDNTLLEEEFTKLKTALVNVAKRQQQWHQEIPARWLPLERSLMKMRATATIVTLDDVLQADRDNEVRINDVEEILLFLRYQHAIGGLIYFEDEGLSDSVVLDPQWIIDAFKCLITAKRFCKRNSELRPLWAELQEKAILKNELINEVWKTEKDGSFLQEREKLLSYMERLDIIAQPKIVLEDGSIKSCEDYFVPSLLKVKGKQNVLQPVPGSKQCSPCLCFVFEEGFVPPVVFQRMLCGCLSKYSILSMGGVVQLFCDLGIFKLDMCHSFIFRMDGDVMKIQVVNMVEEKVESSLCDKLRRFMTSLLESELGRYQQNMAFSVCIECERMDRLTDELLNCKELLKNEKLPCLAHSDSHTVHASSILNSWFPDYVEIPQGQTTLHSWIDNLPSEIKNREVTPKDLSKISKSLGFNWEFVPLELGLTQVDINQSKMDYKCQTAMEIFDTLMKWSKAKKQHATMYELVKAIQQNSSVEVNWEMVKNVVDGI